jgi:hypothetical protein
MCGAGRGRRGTDMCVQQQYVAAASTDGRSRVATCVGCPDALISSRRLGGSTSPCTHGSLELNGKKALLVGHSIIYTIQL